MIFCGIVGNHICQQTKSRNVAACFKLLMGATLFSKS